MTTLGLLVAMLTVRMALGQQPMPPQPWWPTQPSALPFVHPLFTNDMVVQRDVAAPIWGWSSPGDAITVAVDGKPTEPRAVAGDDGKWKSKIGPLPAGGPHSITVEGTRQVATFTNVLFGDVWLCAGQSNMNWPVRLSANSETEVKRATYPRIRSFNVGFYPALVPMKLPSPARWEVCTPEFARNFTAVGYFFARDIHQSQKIPVGILHSSAGATAAEAWTSAAALRQRMPFDFHKELAEVEQAAAQGGPAYDYFREVENWAATVDSVSARKKYVSEAALDPSDWRDVTIPKPWQEAGLDGFNGLAWFRHTIDVPAEWAGKEVRLHLSVVNDTDITWFNGTLVGCTQIRGNSRTYVVAGRLVKPGKNVLVVAVLAKEGPGGFCSSPNNMVLRCPAFDKNLRLAGTWKAKAGVPVEQISVPFPMPQVRDYKTITAMYNGMIAPLEPFAIKGALWYQGEANGPRWMQYRRLLPTLIADWRERFQVGEFPFLIVSLAAYNPVQMKPVEPGWAEIRESQWRTVRRVPNTGLAVTIDLGDAKDIHPRNKREVGRRLALTARHLVYGDKKLIYSGPEFTEMMIEPPKGDRIRLYFKHLGGGLMIRPGDKKLTGFAVAGPDKKFIWADAVIDGNTVVVSSSEVPDPKHVRYGWAWNPTVNLFNKEGLPAIPFRTDE
jgi:sialate O-acetylesterase